MWYVYILRCRDGSLYAGTTLDLKRRLKEHNEDDKLGSKFVRSRRPVSLVYSEKLPTKNLALKRELEIKGWNRHKKLELIKSVP